MKLKDLFYFGTDSTFKAVRTKATVEGGAVFPFQVKDDKGVFINIIKYHDPKDSTHETTLTRNRRFIKETKYIYRDVQYDAIEFEMKEEQAERDLKKGGWSHVYPIQEVYVKGIGQVYTKREISEGRASPRPRLRASAAAPSRAPATARALWTWDPSRFLRGVGR